MSRFCPTGHSNLKAKLHRVPATMRFAPLLRSTLTVTQPQDTPSSFCMRNEGALHHLPGVLHLSCFSSGVGECEWWGQPAVPPRQLSLAPVHEGGGFNGKMQGWMLHSWKQWALLTSWECHWLLLHISFFLFIPVALIQILALKKLSAFEL